jgi:hypothetical protein
MEASRRVSSAVPFTTQSENHEACPKAIAAIGTS